MIYSFSEGIWIGEAALRRLITVIGVAYGENYEFDQDYSTRFRGCNLLAEILLELACDGDLRFEIIRSRQDEPTETFTVPDDPGWPSAHEERVLLVMHELVKGGNLSVAIKLDSHDEKEVGDAEA